MTLKGKKNHYNVKLLRGYGCSIRLKANRICLRDGADPFTGQAEKEEWFVTQIPYERIVISGKGYLSTEVLKLLSEKNINVILTDTYGNLVTAMHKVMSSPTATNYRIAQYDTFRNSDKVMYLQKNLLADKLQSQISFLKDLRREEVNEAITGLEVYLSRIYSPTTKDKRDLLTIESRAGHLYFRNYAKLFPQKYGFISRHGGGLVMSNRYASDVVNGLLNYGYTVLAGEIAKFVNGIGLDPAIGFLHELAPSKSPLVYDIQELFRWLIDISVIELLEQKKIKKSDFITTENYHIRLTEKAAKSLIERISLNFNRKMDYKNGKKFTYQNILLDNVQQLANFISAKTMKMSFNLPHVQVLRQDSLGIQKKILDISSEDRRKLGINKSTLWYQRQKLMAGKSIKVYRRVLSKLT